MDLIFLTVCALLSFVSLILPVPVREPIAAALRRSILAPLVMLQERAELSRRAFLLHEPITAERDSVALRAMNVTALEIENARLRKVIGFGAKMKWGFVPAEALRTRAVRDPSSLLLSAGSRAGVQRLSPVISPEGLVGVVESVDPTLSRALMWTHPEFRVSAMTPDATIFGIVQAHGISGSGAANSGGIMGIGGSTGEYLMELRGVPFRGQLKPGQVIVSSGLGGVFPRGIPIGTVMQEIKGVESWARTYLIRPAVFPDDVNSVMILLPVRGAQGVENLWEIGEQIQDATAQIVAAGDSLGRQAALAEAAARRAAIDSTRRDSLGQVIPPRPVQYDSLGRPIAPLPPPVRRPPVVPQPVPNVPRSQIDTSRDSTRI